VTPASGRFQTPTLSSTPLSRGRIQGLYTADGCRVRSARHRDAELEAADPRPAGRAVRALDRATDELGQRQACAIRLADQKRMLTIGERDLGPPAHLM